MRDNKTTRLVVMISIILFLLDGIIILNCFWGIIMNIDFADVCNFFKANLSPLGAAVVIVLIILAVIFFKILPGTISAFELFMPKEKRYARKELENKINNLIKDLRNEQVLFDDDPISKRKYYKRHLFQVSNKYKKKINATENFVVRGEPGVGKSSCFRDIFFRKNDMRFTFGRRTLFFDYEHMKEIIDDESELGKLTENIRLAEFSSLRILFDGIDELGEERFKSLINRVIPMIRQAQAKAIIGMSVRENFYYEHTQDLKLPKYKDIQITPWKKEDAKQYGHKLIKWISHNFNSVDEKHIKTIFDKNFTDRILNNPLTIKMYIYILINNPKKDLSKIEDRYSLYDCFVDVLLCRNNMKYSDLNKLEERKKELSEGCFKAYENNDKLIDESKDPRGLFKSNGMLIHETFFEFFVARYYVTTIIESDETTNMFQKRVNALELEYSNEYSDFISDAVDSLTEEKQIHFLKTLCNIYLYTLENEELQKRFADIAKIDKPLEPNNITIISKEKKTSDKRLFNLKMQIVFRFGRMDHAIKDPDLSSILKFLYMNDRNVYVKDEKIQDYYLILFKRGCAISSSIAEDSDVEIEIDYVKHMLDFCDYNVTYDLANRSHTIVFYGDINKDRSLFEFKDQACSVHPTKSIEKRIARLSNMIPDSLYGLKGKERKTYGFRLFDLATIYTFICSRNDLVISPEQIEIIRSCRVCFEGQPKEREQLMMEIKNRILELLN